MKKVWRIGHHSWPRQWAKPPRLNLERTVTGESSLIATQRGHQNIIPEQSPPSNCQECAKKSVFKYFIQHKNRNILLKWLEFFTGLFGQHLYPINSPNRCVWLQNDSLHVEFYKNHVPQQTTPHVTLLSRFEEKVFAYSVALESQAIIFCIYNSTTNQSSRPRVSQP